MIKKTLLISPCPPPIGGIASWSINILSYINNNKIKNIYHIDSAIKHRNITDYSKSKRIIGGTLDTFNIFFDFILICIKYKPKTVHYTSSASLSLLKDILFALACRIMNIKYIIHFRFGRIPILSLQKSIEWYFLCFVIKVSNECIVIDENSYNYLKPIFNNKIHCIPNPCSEDLKQVALRNVSDKKQNKIIFVGHVVKQKGIYELIKAFALLDLTYILEIIGPYEMNIKDQLESILKIQSKSDNKKINFRGSLDKNMVLDEMKKAKLLVLPSYTEGFPNVVLEAMACGCPVLATNVGAIPQMLDINTPHPCGICIPPKEELLLATKLKELLKDEKNLFNMGLNGKNKVLNSYTMDSIFPKYQNLWY